MLQRAVHLNIIIIIPLPGTVHCAGIYDILPYNYALPAFQ